MSQIKSITWFRSEGGDYGELVIRTEDNEYQISAVRPTQTSLSCYVSGGGLFSVSFVPSKYVPDGWTNDQEK